VSFRMSLDDLEWLIAKYSMTRVIARALCDSRATCSTKSERLGTVCLLINFWLYFVFVNRSYAEVRYSSWSVRSLYQPTTNCDRHVKGLAMFRLNGIKMLILYANLAKESWRILATEPTAHNSNKKQAIFCKVK